MFVRILVGFGGGVNGCKVKSSRVKRQRQIGGSFA